VDIRKRTLTFAIVLAVTLPRFTAHAAQIAANGFSVRHERVVQAPTSRVYEALIGQVGTWWNPQHTYSGDSKNLSIDVRPGGCFCERLPNGGVEHMRVVYIKANEMLRLSGGLGPLQGAGLAGSMTWRVTPVDTGTKLELVYNVGGFMAGGFEAIAPAVEQVLGEQVDRLKRFVETGSPAEAK